MTADDTQTVTQYKKPEHYTKKTIKAKPFLKWAGGKGQLLQVFNTLYPQALKNGECSHYIEPFIGGGAVYFDVIQNYPIRSAYLSDINPEIVIAYKVIQAAVDSLIERLGEISEKYHLLTSDQQKELYYRVRTKYNEQSKGIDYLNFSERWIERTVDLIFLNKTCFNGLFRVNKSRFFNTPYGRYKKPTILDAENLRAVNSVLQFTDIELADFEESVKAVKDETFIYLDPPYRPLNKTSSFTSYSALEFNDFEQKRLSEFYKRLHRDHRVYLMLSNSDPKNVDESDEFFDKLYQEFNIKRVLATRMINSNSSKRGRLLELVITNY